MQIVIVILLAACVFGVCFLVDRGFRKLFRKQAEYYSGKSVRLSSRVGAFGIILCVLGLSAVFTGIPDQYILLIGGGLIILGGIGLTVYYMTCGIFYDDERFLYASFGKKKTSYRYGDIEAQQLYNASGNILVELHMKNGASVTVQSTMNGAYDFLDHAFSCWCRQRGIPEEDCAFHDPANSLWFPTAEER